MKIFSNEMSSVESSRRKSVEGVYVYVEGDFLQGPGQLVTQGGGV